MSAFKGAESVGSGVQINISETTEASRRAKLRIELLEAIAVPKPAWYIRAIPRNGAWLKGHRVAPVSASPCNRISEARLRNRMSTRELAQALGLSFSDARLLESQTENLSSRQLLNVLGVIEDFARKHPRRSRRRFTELQCTCRDFEMKGCRHVETAEDLGLLYAVFPHRAGRLARRWVRRHSVVALPSDGTSAVFASAGAEPTAEGVIG